MASIINATTTNGVAISADNSGILQLATNSGTTALTLSVAQAATFVSSVTATSLTAPILSSATTLSLQTNGSTTAVTIDASQNVGIGTSSPSTYGKLAIGVSAPASAVTTILGIYQSGGVDNSSLRIAGYRYTGSAQTAIDFIQSSGTTFQSKIAFSTDSGGGMSERMRIDNSGIVTMSAYGAGAATFSAAGVISSVSDETWKIKDGVPTNPDDMLQKLTPGYWFYNDEKKDIFGKDRQLGFYAQNVNQAIGVEAAPIPETYTELDENGTEVIKTKPWGYYDRSVLAVAVMSLQKALTTIEELKLTIDTQQTQITALNAKVGI